ncbi:uncharacterized protein LOC100278895 [Zea mays]|uniref:uncharacterized protein LOC100278895 n=1 Tax=Zea mays TaxID=4577 RepID=UPI002029DA86|nr:uncharacterized protein LOC100278895 [Zea mays]
MAMCEEVPRLHLDPTSDCTMKLRGVVGEFLEKAGSGSPRLFLPLLEKNRWFKRSHTTRSSIRSRWRLPIDFMAPRMDFSSIYIYLLFCKTFAM